MKLEWGYIWRTVVFHIMWVLLSPFAGLFSVSRGSGLKRARERSDDVYDSVYKKFVIRPRLNRPLRDISDADLETLIWLAQKYPVSLTEVAEIWNANDRMVGATIQQIEATTPRKK